MKLRSSIKWSSCTWRAKTSSRFWPTPMPLATMQSESRWLLTTCFSLMTWRPINVTPDGPRTSSHSTLLQCTLALLHTLPRTSTPRSCWSILLASLTSRLPLKSSALFSKTSLFVLAFCSTTATLRTKRLSTRLFVLLTTWRKSASPASCNSFKEYVTLFIYYWAHVLMCLIDFHGCSQ